MTFAHPQLLWLLLAPATLLLAAAFRRARTSVLAHPKIHRAQIQSNGLNYKSAKIPSLTPRPVFATLAIACLIAALARPQGAKLSTPSYTQSRDVIVAVDVSRSMLAEDISPTRLGRAQLLIRNLADELRGERLGLLPFAGTAFLQSPLSADYEIFRTFLDELGPEMIPAGGSNFTALLSTADEAFGPPDSTSPDTPPPSDRYLIILSDGEAQDDAWRPLAGNLSKRGVQIISLGLGTADGAMVPDAHGAFVKDERGAVVLSRLNPSTLQELARLTNGSYRDASAWVDVPALLRDTIARGRTTRSTTETTPRRQELFVWFLIPALTLLAFALFREFPAAPRLSSVSAKNLRPSPPPLPRALLVLFAVHLFVTLNPSTFAAPPTPPADTTPPPAPPDPLVELIGKLSSSPDQSPSDLARLADLTAERGEQSRANPSTSQALPDSAVYDALAAVAAGKAAAPHAADWAALKNRLGALLTPPPKPPESDKSDQSDKSDKSDKSDSSNNSDSSNQSQGEKSDEKSDSQSSESQKSESQKPDDASSPSENKSDSSSSSPDQPSSSDPESKPDAEGSDSTKTNPNGEKPLGDLAKPDAPEESEDDSEKTSPAPSPSASDQRPEPEDTPTQTVGGVSASGRADDASADASATASLDPSLVVPQQRLERVRDSDAPARFYQLLQESELPPDSPERRATANQKRDW